MAKPLAFLNGQFVPAATFCISVDDAGFMQGVTVAEQLRTFQGQLFRLEEHLQRMRTSLDIVGIELDMSFDEIADRARELAKHNHALLAAGDDLGLSIFATPGAYEKFSTEAENSPTFAIRTHPVAFAQFAQQYEVGQRLVITKIRQTSPQNWPLQLKCRSRMHYYLADREARAVDPLARALLLDLEGHVSEASTANVLAHFTDEGLVSPPINKILPGISLHVLEELAGQLRIPFQRRDLYPEELGQADEMLLCSTSPCVLPVVAVDGQAIGTGTAGAIFDQLISAWGEMVGVDVREQARRFAQR